MEDCFGHAKLTPILLHILTTYYRSANKLCVVVYLIHSNISEHSRHINTVFGRHWCNVVQQDIKQKTQMFHEGSVSVIHQFAISICKWLISLSHPCTFK